VADHDPSTPAKADPTRVPGLLDQYREQRRAWLAQADELVRMREDVRHAAEREAIEIVTAARRDVRRIIVEARRELLVLTAQLHAAVDATDAPGIEAPPFTALLADPEARSRVESASHDDHITRDVVHEARKGVRSVLDEARAEIEALSSEAPAIFGQSAASDPAAPRDAYDAAAAQAYAAPREQERRSATEKGPLEDGGPVHELSLDASLAALDFQTRDLPIPTLARLLGAEAAGETPSRPGEGPLTSSAFEPLSSYETPRLSELRTLLRDSIDSGEPADTTSPPTVRTVLSPDVEPPASSPFAFDTTPRTEFFADHDGTAEDAAADSNATGDAGGEETPRFTPPSRLFGEDDSQSSARSARTFVGLFAATGALAVAGTIWWALSRDSAPLSAAAPPVITEKPAATPAASATPAVAAPAPGTMALTIEARRPSWIRAQIDGKDEIGRIYQAGETRHIYGARSVSIRAGDAGAVFVGVDGGTARSMGADGAAATRKFSAAVSPAVANADNAPVSLASATGATPAVADTRAPSAETTGAPPRAPAPVPASQPPAAAGRSATAAADGAPAVRDGVAGGRPDLVQAAQQWLDAYQRRDRDAMSAMATDNVTVSDERSVTERFPAWQGGVQRNLDEVALELTGDVAVFTARMTEHADAGGQHISRVSQFWQRRGARWYVTNVRIIGEARLNQIIR
jgi:ketosteroid isomerase-like protein